MQDLFQKKSFSDCIYTRHKNRSFTDCRESYQHGACKETLILRWNDRTPTKELVLHFLKVLPAEVIKELLPKIFRVLRDNGLEAVANLELTLGKNGKPNNCVHSHILTDDQRAGKELCRLLEIACERQGLVKDVDFCIDYRELWDGDRYFNYFTKYGKKYFHKVILFQKGLLKSGKTPRTLQKFYKIGNWFSKTKEQIWDEIKAYCQENFGSDIEETDCTNDTDLAGVKDDKLSSEPIQSENTEVDNNSDVQHETSDQFVFLK